MHTLLEILDIRPTHLKLSNYMNNSFFLSIYVLYSNIILGVNCKTKFLQVSDMVTEFQDIINRGDTLVVLESLHYR